MMICVWEVLYATQVFSMAGLPIKKTFAMETSGKQIKQTGFHTQGNLLNSAVLFKNGPPCSCQLYAFKSIWAVKCLMVKASAFHYFQILYLLAGLHFTTETSFPPSALPWSKSLLSILVPLILKEKVNSNENLIHGKVWVKVRRLLCGNTLVNQYIPCEEQQN